MKLNQKFNRFYIFLIFTLLIFNCFYSCNTDKPIETIPTGNSREYSILHTDISNLTGTVNFIENENGTITINIEINNTVEGNNNSVSLNRNTANIGGGKELRLNDITGKNGTSVTTVSKLDNGQTITYNELSEFNGYLAITGQDAQEGLLIGYSDLGPNVLTGRNISYNLFSTTGAINGSIALKERKIGTTSLTLGLFDLQNNDSLPSSLSIIYENNSVEIEQELNNITKKLNGFSFNELKEINGNSILYEEILQLNALIKIKSQDNDSIIIAEGGIGSHIDAESF